MENSLPSSAPLFWDSASVLAFFATLPNTIGTRRKYATGEVLFAQLSQDDHLYVVLDGIVNLQSQTADGTYKAIGQTEAGGILGEGILWGKTTKDAQAIAQTSVSAILLTQEDITLLTEIYPTQIRQLLAFLLRLTNERLSGVSAELALLSECTERLMVLSLRGRTWVLEFLQGLSRTLKLTAIVLVESHPVVQSLFAYRFDSRFPSVRLAERAGEEIYASLSGFVPNPEQYRGGSLGKSLYAVPLNQNTTLRGFLLLAHTSQVEPRAIRIISNLAPLIVTSLGEA